jgi:hypothetical protein
VTCSAESIFPTTVSIFASTDSYLELSSGAALATRGLLELIKSRGCDYRSMSCSVLDDQEETPRENVLASMDLPATSVGATLSRGGAAEVCDRAGNPKRTLEARTNPSHTATNCDDPRRMRRIVPPT